MLQDGLHVRHGSLVRRSHREPPMPLSGDADKKRDAFLEKLGLSRKSQRSHTLDSIGPPRSTVCGKWRREDRKIPKNHRSARCGARMKSVVGGASLQMSSNLNVHIK